MHKMANYSDIKKHLIFVRKPFFIGVFLHSIIWLILVNFDETMFNFLCYETSCYALIVYDLPISIFYFEGNHITVTFMSLFLGAGLWGFISFTLSIIIRYRHNKAMQNILTRRSANGYMVHDDELSRYTKGTNI